MVREVAGYCTLCRSRCATVSAVNNDRLITVRANPDHPTGRATCAKGRAAPELVHSTRRLLKPLRRTRPKGADDPGWEEIEWNAALNEVAARLDGLRSRYGAESVAFSVTSPSGSSLSDSIDWIERFIRYFGSPNICYATEICNWHKDFAHAFTFGCGMQNPDYRNADLILLWGHNPASSWLAQAGEIGDAVARGAKLIVVDPRRTAHAARAHHWLRVRPGTDAALALGLINLLITEELFDEDFVRRWTNAPFLVRSDNGTLLRASDLNHPGCGEAYVAMEPDGTPIICDTRLEPHSKLNTAVLRGGVELSTRQGRIVGRPVFDLLAERSAGFQPDRVERLTGVPATALREAAGAIGTARSVAYYSWNGLAQHTNATQAERAVACLYALTGDFDVPGGNVVLSRQPVNRVSDLSHLAPSQRAKALGRAERPIGPPAAGWVTARDLYTAIIDRTPYPVLGLVGFGTNLLVSQADTVRAAQALRSLDFYVHCDLFENPSARYADILLPAASSWEQEALKVGFEINAAAEEIIMLRPRVIPAQGEARSDRAIVFELAHRLGLDQVFFDGDMDRAWDHVLAPLGLTVAELRRRPEGVRRALVQGHRKYAERQGDGVRGFATESRRVELYSEKFLRHGYTPLPDAKPDTAAGKGDAFPLILTTGKSGYYCHSQHRSLASLRLRAPEPFVYLHPTLAAAKGIKAGTRAAIRTKAGQAVFRVRLDVDLHPDVVAADYGWWQSCSDLGLPGSDPLSDEGTNYNRLIASDERDPVSGAVAHRSFGCDVIPWTAAGPYPWGGYRPFRVIALQRETEDTLTVQLSAEDGGPLPDFLPGQHLLIQASLGSEAKPITRAYSLISSATEKFRSTYGISVRRLNASASKPALFSTYVNRDLRIGDRILAKIPSGAFTLPLACDFPVILVAAGIGITPFISYLETIARQINNSPEILLLYGNRNSEHHAFNRRLNEFRKQLPRLKIIDFYSRPSEGDKAPRDFDRIGRISPQDIPGGLIERRGRFYICGPQQLIMDVRDGLVERGVPRFEIFCEIFHSISETSLLPDARFKVTFARSGRELVWHRSCGSLLDFIEAEGISVSSGCRVGQCESCSVRILQGRAHHLLRMDHLDADVCLTCQAVPASDLCLEI
jgi:anaerobic selenocysteine-containing dehydrogenase/ferredoxin-NADP reductase